MADLLHALLEAAGTFRVLEDHGVPVCIRGRQQSVPCADPDCRAAAWVHGSAIVCTALRHCRWRAGTAVDYLVHRQRWTVRDTLVRLHTLYPQKLARIGGQDWAEAVDPLVERIERRRQLFEFFLTRREPDTSTPELAQAREHLQAQGLDWQIRQLTVFLLSEDDCSTLSRLAGAVAEEGQLFAYPCRGGALVMPLLVDPLTIGAISVQPLDKKYQTQRWDLAPTRMMFSGLWELRGGDAEQAVLSCRPFQAAAQSIRGVERNQPWIGVVLHRESVEPARLRFVSAAYQMQPDESIALVAELRRLFPPDGLSVIPAAGGPAGSWLDFLTQRMVALLQEPAGPGAVRRELERLDLSPEELVRWQQLLIERNLLALLQLVEARLETEQSEHPVRGALISETATGYVVSKDRGRRFHVSNFTLQFQRNFYFPDNDELYHEGQVLFQGRAFPLLLAGSSLRRVALLERAVQQAVAPHLTPDAGATPGIVDKVMAAPLVLHLGVKVAELPLHEGISALGWAEDRRRFYGTDWQVDEGRLSRRTTIADPEQKILRHFQFETTPRTPGDAPVSELGRELLALLLAQAARTQRGRPVWPLFFRDTMENNLKLGRLFHRVFGQRSPVPFDLTASPRRELERLRGQPCLGLGACPTAPQKTPLWLLTDAGRLLDGELTDADCSAMADLFARGVGWLASGTRALAFRQSLLHPQDLLVEGRIILKEALGLDLHGRLSEAPVFEALLAQYSPTRLGELLRENFSSQRLVLRLSQCEKSWRDSLCAELRTIDPTFCPGNYATMDLVQGRTLLKCFYQEDVPLPPIGTAAPDDAKWAEQSAAVS